MIDLFTVGRAVGKTTFLIDVVYREPDHQIIVAWEAERDRVLRGLAERCVQDGAPHWTRPREVEQEVQEATAHQDWYRFFARRNVVVTPGNHRGGPRRKLIDNLDAVLTVMFGDVEAATATGVIPRHRIPL